MPYPMMLLTLLVVAIAAITDWRTGQIPNWLTLPAIVAGPIAHLALAGWPGALGSVIGLFAASLIPYFFFRANAMGGGDVKLYAAIGALTGPLLGTEILMLSTALAGLQALVMVLRLGRAREAARTTIQLLLNMLRSRSQRVTIPPESHIPLRLGPAIMVGTLLILVRG